MAHKYASEITANVWSGTVEVFRGFTQVELNQVFMDYRDRKKSDKPFTAKRVPRKKLEALIAAIAYYHEAEAVVTDVDKNYVQVSSPGYQGDAK